MKHTVCYKGIIFSWLCKGTSIKVTFNTGEFAIEMTMDRFDCNCNLVILAFRVCFPQVY